MNQTLTALVREQELEIDKLKRGIKQKDDLIYMSVDSRAKSMIDYLAKLVKKLYIERHKNRVSILLARDELNNNLSSGE